MSKVGRDKKKRKKKEGDTLAEKKARGEQRTPAGALADPVLNLRSRFACWCLQRAS